VTKLASGVDIIEVDRIRRSLERYGSRFSRRFFTPRELDQCHGRATSLAGRFAVKEAVSKALGTGIGDVRWKDVEIVNDERGRPQLVLHGAAQELAMAQGLKTWSISLSHTTAHAVGMVVAMGEED
jgi:holo-[acyl-carrier protein] synthase